MIFSVLLAAILDFLRDSWPGLRTWNSSKQKCYFDIESQVCVSDVHPDVVYNHDNWDFICYFGGHFVLQFWKGKNKNRAWHGTDLESAYPNCVKTTTWQILLRNALQTLRMLLFEKWALTNWPGLRTWNSSKQKCYFDIESQVCVSDVHPDVVYNHDNWDFICYFDGHFVLQFWKGKNKNRAWHGTDLESAYPNCVKTTTWQILLRNALQTLRMLLFEKWALTICKCKYWSAPNGIMITRDPVKKKRHLQCNAETYLQWRESASVVIYSRIHMWNYRLGRRWRARHFLKACTVAVAHRLGGSEFQSVIVLGSTCSCICMCLLMCLSASVAVFIYVSGVACSSEGYL